MTQTAPEAQANIASLKQIAIEAGGKAAHAATILGLDTTAISDAALGCANNLQHLEDIVETVADLPAGGPTGETYPTVPLSLPSTTEVIKKHFDRCVEMADYLVAELAKIQALSITYGSSTSQLDGLDEYDDHYDDAVDKANDLVTAIDVVADILEPYIHPYRN